MWLSWRHGLPLGTGIWGGEDAEFEPRRLRRTWRLSRFWPITWNQSQSVSPTGAGFGSLHRRLRNRLCSGGSTRNTLPARVPLLSVPPRCSHRGCRPSPPAAVAAVVVVSSAVRRGPPAAQFRRALSPPAAGSPTCSGAARRPGEVSAPGLAVLLGRARLAAPVAWLWRSTGPPSPALPLNFSSTQEQDQPQQHRQRASRSLPQKRKHPGNPGRPVAAVARAGGRR